MFRRNKTVSKLREVEEVFIDSFLKVLLGYTDQFEDLRRECRETH